MSQALLLLLARRFRRGLGLRPINSVKNIVDGTFLGVGAAAITTVGLVDVVNTYAGGVTEVPIGAKVSSVYLFVQVISTGTGTANADFYIIARPAAVVNPVPGTTGGNIARRFILHEEKGIPGNSGDGAAPLTFRGVIKIPRGRQRMGEGDVVQLVIRSADGYNACVKCIYKFYQ